MAVSFAHQVRPLFKTKDINCMRSRGILLDDYTYMSDSTSDATYPDHANAHHVYGHLTGSEHPRMPPGGPFWSDEDLGTFNSWMADGFQP
jgi:hypothetical protein